MVSQRHLIALVGVLLIGGAVLLLVVGCSGTSSETSNKKEKGHSPEATASKEDARCEGTRTIKSPKGALRGIYTTNDLPGCPKGGLLLGTNGKDKLAGEKGDDEIRGLGAADSIQGGDGNDVIYSGDGNDQIILGGDGNDVIYGGPGDDADVYGDKGDDAIYGGDGDDLLDVGGGRGKDVIYGGDGNDSIGAEADGQRDKLYCGKGKDRYLAIRFDKIDYVDSSCEKKVGARGMW